MRPRPSFERTWIGGVREAGGMCSCSGCLTLGVVAVGVGSETGRGVLKRVPSARRLPGRPDGPGDGAQVGLPLARHMVGRRRTRFRG